MRANPEQIARFMMIYRREDLKQHGVKGQRWGVRRTKAALARAARREGREPPSPEAARAKELSKKKRSQLTNEELRFLNERQNLEQNNRRLNPTVVERGHNRTKAVLAVAGTAVAAERFINSPTGKLAIAAGKAAVGNMLARSSLNLLPGGLPIKVG